MALDFPSNPANGQVFQEYFWDASTGAWRGIGSPNNLGDQLSGVVTRQYNPNYVINGGFDVWQRGTSFTANGYTADRWSATVSGTCTHTRETSDVPTGARYAYRWTTGANSSFGQIRQFIETATVIPLRNKTVTASAFVKISANFTGTLSFEIFSSSTTDSISGFSGSPLSQIVTGTPNSSGYTRITSTFTVPSNAVGLYIGIVPTQVQVSGAFALMANVQLEEGSIATSFRRNANSIQGELAACQRYYFRFTQATNVRVLGTAYSWNGSETLYTMSLPVNLRAEATTGSMSSISSALFLGNNTNYTGATLQSIYATTNTLTIAFNLTTPLNQTTLFRPVNGSFFEVGAEL